MSPPQDFRDHACDIGDAALDCLSGITVQYLPRAGGKFTIRAIFDKQWEHVDPDTEVVVTSNQPMIDIKLKDLPRKPEKGDCVIVEGVTYRVIDSQEDGLAMVKLLLHEVT